MFSIKELPDSGSLFRSVTSQAHFDPLDLLKEPQSQTLNELKSLGGLFKPDFAILETKSILFLKHFRYLPKIGSI